MPFLRYVPFIAAVGVGLALLAGAGRNTPTPDALTTPFSPPPPAIPIDAATKALDAAVRALEPAGVAWLETTIKQRVHLPGLEYEAEGCYRAAPNNRYRLELRTHVGKTTGIVLAVSDGAEVWRANRAGDGAWTDVRRVGLRQVLEGHDVSLQQRDDFYRGPAFTGPAPLLKNLQRRMVWAKRAEVRADGRAAVELTGVWPSEQLAVLVPKYAEWPAGMPDRCRLLLDADTFWPRRVEWWGPTMAGKGLVCLVQMELPDPILNRPLPPDECARTFSFQPGSASVVDETGAWMGTLPGQKQKATP